MRGVQAYQQTPEEINELYVSGLDHLNEMNA